MRLIANPALFAAALLPLACGCSPADKPEDGSADEATPEEAPDATEDATVEELPCPEGLADCGGVCVDLRWSHGNCGLCGRSCDDAMTCDEGVCTAHCPEGTTSCGGRCVDVKKDPGNCGVCGHACSAGLHAVAVCGGGACAIECEPGWVDFDRDGITCEGPCTTEFCDGLDDDCDGLTDEDFTCAAGATEQRPCGKCGTLTASCTSECSWSEGACAGEGACGPDETEACGNCGTRACTPSCAWGDCTGDKIADSQPCTAGDGCCSGDCCYCRLCKAEGQRCYQTCNP